MSWQNLTGLVRYDVRWLSDMEIGGFGVFLPRLDVGSGSANCLAKSAYGLFLGFIVL